MKPGTRHTPGYSQQQSARMKAIYANPDLRARVAKRTAETWRDGTRMSASLSTSMLERLEEAWAAAGPQARRDFLARRFTDIGGPRTPCKGSR